MELDWDKLVITKSKKVDLLEGISGEFLVLNECDGKKRKYFSTNPSNIREQMDVRGS
jgi:hypothetical protein